MNAALSSPDARQAVIATWLDQQLGDGCWQLQPASADASFRRYFRVATHSGERGEGEPAARDPATSILPMPSLILMDAPPDREPIEPWLDIARRLRDAGLHAPAVRASDTGLGLILMEDLGDQWLLSALQSAVQHGPEQNRVAVETLYQPCLAALLRLQQHVDCTNLPAYNEPRLVAEVELFPKWFLTEHLGYTPTCSEWDEIESVFTIIINQALQQPKVFVHRDYHSRNLLVTGGANPGIIDFQDAVRGPITYDLVSLLKDCYIRWPQTQVQAWVDDYHQQCLAAELVNCDRDTFSRWFDLMGLQRHLKVLGIFCRLWYRDGKAGYLSDLPLVLDYVLETCERYDATINFGRWLRDLTAGRDLTVARAR